MAYLFVALALFCLTVKGYYGKRTSNCVRGTSDAYLFTLLRMVICMLIGLAMVFLDGAGSDLALDAGFFWICVLSGVANATMLAAWILAVQHNTMVMVDVSVTLGSLIPTLLCAALFGEAISLPKMLGFALILLASFVLAGRGGPRRRGSLLGIFLLVLSAVGDGISGFAQQLYKQLYTEGGMHFVGTSYPKTVFHFYTYVFAALVLLLLYVGMRMKQSRSDAEPAEELRESKLSLVLQIAIMAACLFAASYFQTVATNDYGMSSQILYPTIKGGCLITVNFTAMLFFREPITKRSACGSLLALGGIVLMSIL